MKNFAVLVASTLAVAGAGDDFAKIAGYEPSSQVADHCAIDLDQAAIEAQLARGTEQSFDRAMRIYKEGGHSKSYAQVTLATPLVSRLEEGTEITGRSAAGETVVGVAYQYYANGASFIKVQYAATDPQAGSAGCQVGGLPEKDVSLDRCFAGQGELTIDGRVYAYVYDPLVDNNNGRTLELLIETI